MGFDGECHKDCFSTQQQQLLSGLIELYRNEQLVDVTLCAEEQKFPCHKAVLAASSPYFRAMFTCGLVEGDGNGQREVTLYDVSKDALAVVLEYLYTAKININNENVQTIFTTANMFELLQIYEMCTNHMIRQLHISNCVGVYQFGSFHNCTELKHKAKDFVLDHFTELIESEDLMLLNFEDFAELICNDNLNVKEEEIVYETSMKWLEYNLANRLCFLPELFQCVRLALISDHFIGEKIATNELVMDNSSCRGLLSMAKLYKLNEENIESEKLENCPRPNPKLLDVNAKPRLGMYTNKMMVFVGGSQDKHSRALTCFDPISKRNYYAIPLHISYDFKYRIDHHRAVVTEKNQIYLLGGIFYEEHHFEETGDALNEVKVFSPHHRKWIDKPPMLYPRCAHAAVYHNDHIYAIGGKSLYPTGPTLANMEAYSVIDEEWQREPDMPVPLYHHCAVVYKDNIYVVGGKSSNDQVTNHCLEFDTLTHQWTWLCTKFHHARAEFAATVVHDKLFIIGGTDGSVKICSMEMFNFSTKKWQFGPDFPEDRKAMACVTFDDCVYVCGGVRLLISRINQRPRLVETRDLWKYDPITGYWNREAKLVQYANIYGCVVAEVNAKRLCESEFISSS